MAREKKKAKKHKNRNNASLRWRLRGYLRVTSTPPLGMNVFSAIMDEANFTSPLYTYCDYEMSKPEKHDNAMLAMAETMASPQEVVNRLGLIADGALRNVKKRGDTKREARRSMIEALNAYCEKHYFGNFRRKRTIDKIVKHKLNGYEAWEAQVDCLAEKLCMKEKSLSLETARRRAAYQLS